MTYDELISNLGRLRGSGVWRQLADSSGINYDTIARIYRGDMPNPGIRTVERLVHAIELLSPDRRQNTKLAQKWPEVLEDRRKPSGE